MHCAHIITIYIFQQCQNFTPSEDNFEKNFYENNADNKIESRAKWDSHL